MQKSSVITLGLHVEIKGENGVLALAYLAEEKREYRQYLLMRYLDFTLLIEDEDTRGVDDVSLLEESEDALMERVEKVLDEKFNRMQYRPSRKLDEEFNRMQYLRMCEVGNKVAYWRRKLYAVERRDITMRMRTESEDRHKLHLDAAFCMERLDEQSTEYFCLKIEQIFPYVRIDMIDSGCTDFSKT